VLINRKIELKEKIVELPLEENLEVHEEPRYVHVDDGEEEGNSLLLNYIPRSKSYREWKS
jgi:hypothetical protein